jgi:hypothetical protein
LPHHPYPSWIHPIHRYPFFPMRQAVQVMIVRKERD